MSLPDSYQVFAFLLKFISSPNQKTNTFIEIPIKGIDCFNDEFENEE
jgi:hypothetical protein